MAALDPRLEELFGSPTGNERAMAWSIRRAMRNLRLANGESRRILGFLNREVFPDIEAKLRRYLEAEDRVGRPLTQTAQRTAAMGRIIGETLRPGLERARVATESTLSNAGAAEANATAARLNAIMPQGVQVDFIAPAPSTIAAAVRSEPFVGDLLRNWYDAEEERTRRAVIREINVGTVQGEPVDAIMRRIRGTAANNFEDGVLAGTRREIEALARTSVRHITERARQMTYEANGDLVKGYKWVATLDTRTCMVCAPLDGAVYLFADDGPRREPPAHFNCRCSTTPILELPNAKIEGLPPGQRASATGPVPRTQNFSDWLKGESKAVQEEVLGVKKAAMFRQGQLRLGDFVDRKDKVLTLDQLDRLEKMAD